MFKKEYIVTKHAAQSQPEPIKVYASFPEDPLETQDFLVMARANTVTESIRSLLNALMSEGILRSLHESPYDELLRYQIDEIAYRIGDSVYMITEIIDDDCSSISYVFNNITI